MPVATLRKPDPMTDDNFGYAVAISGTRIVVGAYGGSNSPTNAGNAYVFDMAGTTPTTPVFTLNNPGPAAGDAFGFSAAISGTRIAIGAPGDTTGAYAAGSAYVYDVASATPTVPAWFASP